MIFLAVDGVNGPTWVNPEHVAAVYVSRRVDPAPGILNGLEVKAQLAVVLAGNDRPIFGIVEALDAAANRMMDFVNLCATPL